MLVLHDPDTLLHDTVELLGAKIRPALESPARIQAIIDTIYRSKHELRSVTSPLDNDSELARLLHLIRESHKDDYVQHLHEVFKRWRQAGLIEQDESVLPECFVFDNKARTTTEPPKDIYARAGYFAFDMSSGVMDKSYTSIVASANLAVEAVEQLREHEVNEVLALCRPPGHHCNGRRAGGYCYVNNIAVAVSAWRKKTSPNARVGILDIDFHHGNGTQDIFYSDPAVFYTSIHGADEFPYYTGKSDETGAGEAIGTNLNLPLATGSSFDDYLEKLDLALCGLSEFRPEMILVSLGFDTFHLDPLGNFKIYTEDYAVTARTVRQRLPSTPAAILLEGGYALQHLGANVLSFLSGWEAQD